MLWFLFVLLITIIVFVICCINEGGIKLIDFGDYCFSIIIGLAIGTILFGMFTTICYFFAQRECFLEKTVSICALQDNTDIEGKFYLGSGKINSQLQYSFATNENGFIHISTINSNVADFAYVNENPYIEYWRHQYKNKFLRKYVYVGVFYQYRIFIPEGTIKYDFNVDLQ